MRITADTNVLLRALVRDDPRQAAAAEALLQRATVIAVPLPVFCELAWVLRRKYAHSPAAVADAIEAIAEREGVATDQPAVEAGLALLRAGGDFADGAIAYQGMSLGGPIFASFDRTAVTQLRAGGVKAGDPAD